MKTMQAGADYFKESGVIIGSKAYARYDKTQAFQAGAGDGITRRWLHVQLVSHVARWIARLLRCDEYLTEAIALGHDLGHTPYGHEGEAYLNALCMESGCGFFAHNAQSARILTVLENGLELSLPVLDGILCHNGEMLRRQYVPNYRKTWTCFETELNSCFKVAHYSTLIMPMTLEGCIVRASDVIAYLGRDIEDAIAVGLITRGDIPDQIACVLGDTEASIRDILIDDLVRQSSSSMVAFSKRVFKAIEGLLAFNYRAIYSYAASEQLRKKRESSFRFLFYSCCEQLRRGMDSDIGRWVKAMDRGYISTTSIKRMVADYIGSMTDAAFERASAESERSN